MEGVQGSAMAAFGNMYSDCLLYTSDAADDSLRVDLGGRRIIKKKKKKKIIINFFFFSSRRLHTIFFFFKQKTAYEIGVRLVGSEMCIRDSSMPTMLPMLQNSTSANGRNWMI